METEPAGHPGGVRCPGVAFAHPADAAEAVLDVLQPHVALRVFAFLKCLQVEPPAFGSDKQSPV